MKKRKIIIAGLLLTLVTVLATGCKDDDREDYLEDRVEQLEQQVTDLEKKNAGSTTSQTPPANTDNAGNEGADSSNAKASDYGTIETSVNDISEKINSTTPTGSATEQRDQYYNLKQELKDVEHQLDLYDTELESQYHSGTLEAADYQDKERQLDLLEDTLDTSEDKLERLFGIDD